MLLPNDPRLLIPGMNPNPNPLIPRVMPGPGPSPIRPRLMPLDMAPLKVPPPEQPKLNIWSKLFGGDQGQYADNAQANEAGKSGLMQAGLSLLANNGLHRPGAGPSLMQNIAGAVGAGQQGFQANLAERQKQSMLSEREKIKQKYAGRSDPNSLVAMMQDLIAIGDMESAKPLAEYLKSAASSGGMNRLAFQRVKGKNEQGKEGMYLIGLDPASGREVSRQFVEGAEDEDGLNAYQKIMTSNSLASAEDRMFNDWQQATRDIRVTSDYWAQINSARKWALEGNAAAQMALIFGFMKMMDPNSTVREGEYATAQNAAGASERARNIYNKLLDGQFMDKEQVQRFLDQADRSADEWRKKQNKLQKQWEEKANRRGYDPRNTYVDWWGDAAGVVDFDSQAMIDKANLVRERLGLPLLGGGSWGGKP